MGTSRLTNIWIRLKNPTWKTKALVAACFVFFVGVPVVIFTLVSAVRGHYENEGALLMAIKSGNVSKFNALVSANPENARNILGCGESYATHLAIESGNEEMIRLVLSRACDDVFKIYPHSRKVGGSQLNFAMDKSHNTLKVVLDSAKIISNKHFEVAFTHAEERQDCTSMSLLNESARRHGKSVRFVSSLKCDWK